MGPAPCLGLPFEPTRTKAQRPRMRAQYRLRRSTRGAPGGYTFHPALFCRSRREVALPGDGHVVQSPPIAVAAGGEADLVERLIGHDAEEAVVDAARVGEDPGEIEVMPKDVQRRVVAILPAVRRIALPVHREHVRRPREDRWVEPQLERRGLLRARLVAQFDAFDLLVV